jgi:hypothetical protein
MIVSQNCREQEGTLIDRLQQPKQPVISMQRLCKRVSTAPNSHDCSNRHERNNRGTAGGGVLCWVHVEAIPGETKTD